MLNKIKHIFLGKDKEDKTIQQALNYYSRSKLTIELTNDILMKKTYMPVCL